MKGMKGSTAAGSGLNVPAHGCEARCECGQLMAKLRGNGIELKCKRCRRLVVIPFSGIEGWPRAEP